MSPFYISALQNGGVKMKCCQICNSTENLENLTIDNELITICNECKSQHLKQCYDCQEFFLDTENDYVIDYAGDIYCESCSENLSYCEKCNEYHNSDDFVKIENIDEYWCAGCAESHAYRCSDCGDWVSDNYGDDTTYLCQLCYENSYFRCDDCDEIYHIDDMYSTDFGCYCEYCYNENHAHNDLIHDYSYTPDLNFQSSNNETAKVLPYLGFELESGGLSSSYDCNNIAEKITENNDDIFYLKEDGSIPNYGFELVSHPITLKRHKELDWQNILVTMSNNGLKSHGLGEESCGLHVHVSRNFLTPYKWILLDWLVSKYQDKFELLARRQENHWAKFKKNSNESVKDTYGKSSCRYQAVNFCNYHTVEFRLFRGTLKYSTFMATLELVDALVHWAKQFSINNIMQTKDAFVDFQKYVLTHQNLYNNLIEYMEVKLCA